MKAILSIRRLVAVSILITCQVGLAQPWSVSATNKPLVRPPDPNWNGIVPPATPPPVQVVPPPHHPQPAAPPLLSNTPLPAGLLAFDAEQKECTVKPGEQNCPFVFTVTNVSPAEITVSFIQTSCGCTTANIKLPMKLAPGGTGEIPINMNVLGKSGTVIKTVTVHTDKGQKVLMVKSQIPPPSADPAAMAMNRDRNLQIAQADRQAVFKGDCAKCHVEPVIGKMGRELFTAACGICHEAEHRASMVPDLHQLKVTPNEEYWKFYIVNGKPATLMPAFAQSQGGPLSDAQIASLVEYMVKDFPATKTNAPAAHAH